MTGTDAGDEWHLAHQRPRLVRRAYRVYRSLIRHRFIVKAAVDIAALLFGIVLGTLLRFEFTLSDVDWRYLLVVLPIAAVLQLVAGLVTGVYVGRYRLGSFEEMVALVQAVAATGVVLAAVDLAVSPRLIPLSVTLVGPVVGLVTMAAYRSSWRVALERRRRPSETAANRLIVFGAGEGGTQVITSIMHSPDSSYFPVALLDDDPRKAGLRILGVRCRGGRDRLTAVARDTRATDLLIAIPSAGAQLLKELDELAREADLRVKVLPPVSELYDDRVGVADIRPLSEADLLGRHQIDTDLDSIAGYLTGRRVLVTGAGGSIGSELCRQIHRFDPAVLVMLDRDESALHGVQLSIEGRALLDSENLVVCDIRDAERLDEVFDHHRPEVVFHAAALKHLTLLQQYPSEAVKTNVWGTENVLDASVRYGVRTFVNVSTDKAADPTSVLGYTKRIAERLTAHHATMSPEGVYLSVRFGNVLGSRGSVLGVFRAQIDSGGPLTVTDPEVTRFFMTVEEAVQLTIQAGAIGRDGEVLVLDMGEPVRIADVARRMATNAGLTGDIVYTGLRPGEKRHEVLFGTGEVDRRPIHPLISHVPAPPIPAEVTHRFVLSGDPETLIAELAALTSDDVATGPAR